ncbi:MAG: hypothetical protein IJQ12_01680 [Lachnospiraceae bacterium]|nr:hypothetical protein [Lachnospiraceae bacterium]
MANPNLVKSAYATEEKKNVRVIDNNARAEERILAAQREWMERMQKEQAQPVQETYDDFGDEFDEGLNAEQLDMLTSDQNVVGTPEDLAGDVSDDMFDDSYAQEPVPEQAPAPAPPPVVQEAAPAVSEEEIEAILSDARAQAEQIIADARTSAAQLTSLAHEQGFSQGLEEGRAKGEGEVKAAFDAEIEERTRQLEEEYQKRLDEIEPEMVDTLTRIYEHVFDVNLREEKKVILHLLQTTLSRIEPNGDFMIHASSADYDAIVDEKQRLREYITNPNAVLEVVEDPLLHENECMIETDGGIFDCSVGVELSELTRKLKLLAMDRRRN